MPSSSPFHFEISRSEIFTIFGLLISWIVVSHAAAQTWTNPEQVFAEDVGRVELPASAVSLETGTHLACEGDPYCEPHSNNLFVLLPEGFIYPTYLGNPHEPRLGAMWVEEEDDGTLFDSTLGGRLGLIRWGPRDRPEGVQLDVLAAAKLRLDPEDELDVRSVDFRVDIPLTWENGPHRYKFGYSHISSHLGDEFLLKNPGFNRLNYFRDSLVLGYSYYARPDIRLYGEAAYAFWREVAGPWRFTFGVDYAPHGPRGSPLPGIERRPARRG